MGTNFGEIGVEIPKYHLLHPSPDYEISKYYPSIVAQVTYYLVQLRGNLGGGFSILANYIGALGQPQNKKPKKIAMTAPVITESISVRVAEERGKEMTVTMQFVLPDEYKRVEKAPTPVDERVVTRGGGEEIWGGTGEVVERVEKLKKSLGRDGYKVAGQFLLARYNPSWTLPAFRTNENMIPIE
ncbi:hypothetical protein AAC387_Pa11g0040 [Persea americana]